MSGFPQIEMSHLLVDMSFLGNASMLCFPCLRKCHMAVTGIITMSMHEIDRMKVVQAVVDGNLKPMQAAARLGLTTRQV